MSQAIRVMVEEATPHVPFQMFQQFANTTPSAHPPCFDELRAYMQCIDETTDKRKCNWKLKDLLACINKQNST